MVAGMAVTASDPSGIWGLMKEGLAGGWALLEARQKPQANELIKVVANDFATQRATTAGQFRVNDIFEIKVRAIEELRAVVEPVDTKAPGDPTAFKSGCGRSSEGCRTGERGRFPWFRRGISERGGESNNGGNCKRAQRSFRVARIKPCYVGG
jgi:hypothetical protein